MSDIGKIREIYDRQADRVYRTAMIYMKNRQDAEDVVQYVFLTLIEKDITFDSREHENAWMIVAARNRCKDILKSYWKHGVDLKEDTSGLSEDPDNDAEERSGREAALELLMSLPENQREIIFLHYYEGYTVKEVADMTDQKESGVRSAITSAKNTLRKLVTER